VPFNYDQFTPVRQELSMFQFENSEQLEIRKSVRKLVEAEAPKFQNEQYYGTVPKALFHELANLGLTGLAISEEYGGIQAGAVTSMIVMEEIAAVDLGPAIFISVHTMVSGIVEKFGSAEQKARYLPSMSSGKMLGAFALTEPSAGSDASNLATTARVEEGGYVINGEKCYISSAGWADLYVVFARSSAGTGSEGISAFLVPADTRGLTIGKPEKKMGAELSPIATLSFNEMHLPSGALIGELGRGYSIALSGLAGGRVNISACANGISRSAIHAAYTHLKDRKQFGAPLIEQQGLQFMLADMQIKHEASLLLTWQAAQTLESSPAASDNRFFPSMAKCFSTDACMQITTDAVQLLGGAGYIREYRVERMMREAKMLQIVEGTNQIQRVVIARELSKRLS
jgi:alkylation response protein AidB-like acyl-CoA dehydrogenase